MEWVLARGGDGVRTGLEDNIRIPRDRLASSNAELVKLAVDAIGRYSARPATPQEARLVLHLNPVA
jgi:3-keto-5-aminohexanoate cleavage enzyme